MKKTDISIKEFLLLVQDRLHTAEFRQMKRHRHHINSTLYDHSVKVAFLCYKYHKQHPKMQKKIGLRDFVRAALENALLKYPTLTRTQQDMIKITCSR